VHQKNNRRGAGRDRKKTQGRIAGGTNRREGERVLRAQRGRGASQDGGRKERPEVPAVVEGNEREPRKKRFWRNPRKRNWKKQEISFPWEEDRKGN